MKASAMLGLGLGPKPRSPMRAPSPQGGAGTTQGQGGAQGPPGPAQEDDEVSDYTDADESISAPTEFLAEFLSAIMGKDYPTALKYCKLILQYEPNNRTAREFYPLIVEKMSQNTIAEANTDSEDDSSSGGSGSLTGSDDSGSDLSEDDDDDEDDEDDDEEDDEGGGGRRRRKRQQHNDNSSVEYGDSDGTTASYSSLEDEEADPPTTTSPTASSATNATDNEDIANGNQVAHDAGVLLRHCSDSESPTEPISQRLVSELRAKVVPNAVPVGVAARR